MQKSNSVCHIEKQSFRPALGLCCVCVSYSQYLLLPLAIVSVLVSLLLTCPGQLRDQQVVSKPYKRRRRTNRWR